MGFLNSLIIDKGKTKKITTVIQIQDRPVTGIREVACKREGGEGVIFLPDSLSFHLLRVKIDLLEQLFCIAALVFLCIICRNCLQVGILLRRLLAKKLFCFPNIFLFFFFLLKRYLPNDRNGSIPTGSK